MTDYIDIEEKLISESEKRHRKHYLNPNSKTWVHKLLKVFRKTE